VSVFVPNEIDAVGVARGWRLEPFHCRKATPVQFAASTYSQPQHSAPVSALWSVLKNPEIRSWLPRVGRLANVMVKVIVPASSLDTAIVVMSGAFPLSPVGSVNPGRIGERLRVGV